MFRPQLLLGALLAFTSLCVIAHPDHDEEVALTKESVAQLAAKSLPSLIQDKKVAAAWANAQPASITQRKVAGKQAWVVTYKNPDGKVSGGNPLNLVFDDLGNFVEANHAESVQ
jgi:hypothetical protein